MKQLFFILCLFSLAFYNCKTSNSNENAATLNNAHDNPPAAGFDLDHSDAEAIAIADDVMTAMGGYQNWKMTRYISWNFFGKRKLLWDKWTGNVRIEIPEEQTTILVNIHDSTGQAMKDGQLVTDADILQQQFLNKGVSIWINDSYWLVMPFKLKDSGVTLKYKGKAMTLDSTEAKVLQLTFKDVGETPNHKYNVYVDTSTNLVTQWDYFDDAAKDAPRFSTPWADYQPYGNIRLSGNRGKRALTEIEVLETVDEKRFKAF
jgi:hypothetical protein